MNHLMRSVILVVVVGSTPVFAAEKKAPPGASKDFGPQKSTSINLQVGTGLSYPRLMNQDGSYAYFSGYPISLGLDFTFGFEELGLRFGIFVDYESAKYQNTNNGSDRAQSINGNETLYGLTTQIFPFMAGIGYGTVSQTLSDSTAQNISVSAPVIGFTAGVHLINISSSWQIGLQGWYKNSFVNKTQGSGLTNNFSNEKLELFLILRMQPFLQVL